MKRYMQGNEDEEFMGGGKYVGDCVGGDCKRIVGLVNGVCVGRDHLDHFPPLLTDEFDSDSSIHTNSVR